VRDLAQEGPRLRGRLRGRVLQHHGRWSGSSPSARNRPAFRRSAGQVDHGRAAVAAVAVHVLEQVQRGAPAAVEELDVLGLGVQRGALQALRISASSSARRAAAPSARSSRSACRSSAGARADSASG
jgi:hypothetical protein